MVNVFLPTAARTTSCSSPHDRPPLPIVAMRGNCPPLLGRQLGDKPCRQFGGNVGLLRTLRSHRRPLNFVCRPSLFQCSPLRVIAEAGGCASGDTANCVIPIPLCQGTRTGLSGWDDRGRLESLGTYTSFGRNKLAEFRPTIPLTYAVGRPQRIGYDDFADTEPLHRHFIQIERPDPGLANREAADHQSADRQGPDCQSSDRQGADGQRADSPNSAGRRPNGRRPDGRRQRRKPRRPPLPARRQAQRPPRRAVDGPVR